MTDYTPSGDLDLLDYPVAAICGVSAIIDHRCSALSSIADAVAALSCEALRFKEFFKGKKEHVTLLWTLQ